MSMMLYFSLNGEQRSLLQTKRIDATHTPDEWIAMLAPVANVGRAGHQLRTVAAWGTFLFLVIAFMTGVSLHSRPLGITFGLLACAWLGVYYFARSNDLSINLRKFILPLITLLREDIDRDGALTLRLNLDDPMAKAYQTGSEKLRKRQDTEQTTFQITWMEGKTVLADDSTLELTITDHIRQRKTTKRNARGKVKVKFKYRVRHLVEARVGFSRSDYAMAQDMNADADIDGLKVKQGEKRNVLRVRRAVESPSTTDVLPVGAVMSILSSAFNRVHLVQKEGN